jgi:lysozyme
MLKLIKWLLGHEAEVSPVTKNVRRGAVALAAAVSLIAGFEGDRLTPYRDSVGVLTVCYGETHFNPKQTFTEADCREMLKSRVAEVQSQMDPLITVQIPNQMEEAFLSFTYNVGIGNFKNSSVLKYTNRHEFVQACNALLLYDKAYDRKTKKYITLKGLHNRRVYEQKICLQGATQPGGVK